jgi:hypothetical protein
LSDSSSLINPKPFASLKNFTVPFFILKKYYFGKGNPFYKRITFLYK